MKQSKEIFSIKSLVVINHVSSGHIATSKTSRQLKQKIPNKKEWKPNENVICNMKYSEQILYKNNMLL